MRVAPEPVIVISRHEHRSDGRPVRMEGGAYFEVCPCGASRRVSSAGVAEPWHTCERCTYEWGRP